MEDMISHFRTARNVLTWFWSKHNLAVFPIPGAEAFLGAA